MNLNCFVIDNEDHAIEVISKYTARTPGLTLVGAEKNPLVALNKINDGSIQADITFLDIDMPQLSGIELAGLIQPFTKVIFTTGFAKYAVSAFDRDAIDFLLKPIAYERFLKGINKAVESIANKASEPNLRIKDYFFIQSDGRGKLLKVWVDDIVYIESAQNYVRLHLEEEKYLVYLTLQEVEENFNFNKFVRVHRSYLVNIDKVTSVEAGMVHLSDSSAIQLGPSYRKQFLNRINETLLKSKRIN